MSIQNTADTQVAPLSLVQKGLDKLGLKIGTKTQELIGDIALTSLTLSVNAQTAFPLKYYYTTYFTNTALKVLNDFGLIHTEQSSASALDELIYHALLYTMGKSFGLLIGRETDAMLTMLSSPQLVQYTCSQPWFQTIKSSLIKAIGLKTLKQVVIYAAKKQGKKFIEKNLMAPLRMLMNPKEVVKNLQESFQESINGKQDMIQILSESGQEIFDRLRTEEPSMSLLKESIEFGVQAFEQMSEVASKPDLRLSRKKNQLMPLPQRLTAAWGIAGSVVGPEFTSLALINLDTNTGELIIRISTVALSVMTDQPLICTILSECTMSLTSGQLKKITCLEHSSQQLQSTIHRVQEMIAMPLNELKIDLLKQGVRLKDIQEVTKISAQILGAASYICLNWEGHPFAAALSSASFIQYLGVVGENFGIVKAEHFSSERGYFESLPFQIMVGVTLSGLEMMHGSEYSTGMALPAALLTMPFISDQIVSMPIYQQFIEVLLEKTVIPNIQSIKCLSAVETVTTKLGKIVPALEEPIQYISTFAKGARYMEIGGAAVRVIQHPVVVGTADKMVLLVKKGAQVYSKYVISTTVATYAGGLLGVAANLADYPKDKKGIAVGLITLGTSIVTNDPVATSAVSVVANDILRSSFVQESPQRAKQALSVAKQHVSNTLDQAKQMLKSFW